MGAVLSSKHANKIFKIRWGALSKYKKVTGSVDWGLVSKIYGLNFTTFTISLIFNLVKFLVIELKCNKKHDLQFTYYNPRIMCAENRKIYIYFCPLRPNPRLLKENQTRVGD